MQIPKITDEIEKYVVKSRFDTDTKSNAGSVGALELARAALVEENKKKEKEKEE